MNKKKGGDVKMCKYANLKGIEVKTAQQVEVLARILSRESRMVATKHSDVTTKNGEKCSNFGIKRTVIR